jgi:hypothetical protein
MITALIQLLVLALILVVVWWIVKLLATHFGLPPIAVQVVGAIVALIFLLYVLQVLGLGLPRWRGP